MEAPNPGLHLGAKRVDSVLLSKHRILRKLLPEITRRYRSGFFSNVLKAEVR